MSAVIVRAALALVNGEERSGLCFAIQDERIAAIAPFEELRKRFPDAALREYGAGVALVPGFVNGHSHAYQILLRGTGDDLPFARWRDEALYRIIPGLSPEDVRRTFATAFREMLAAGVTTVAEFFYLNGGGNAHAEAVIQAARETGIRLVLARCWMDAPAAPQAFREAIDTAASRTRELMTRFPDANICVAPHSVHAASPEMIRAAGEFARNMNCRMHVHVAEAAYEGKQTAKQSGLTPLRLLESLGVVDERLVAVHAIYVDADEKKMLADARASVIHNPVTNQYLGDGICDVAGLLELGVPVGLGTDANVNASILDEMRAAALLQKLARRDAGAFDAGRAFRLGTSLGAEALGIDAGDFRAGAYADYAVVDLNCLTAPASPLVNALVYRAQAGAVCETFVGGRLRAGSGSNS
ncbi:MAG TPA: amidohydrolase family protein [Candidatus Rubrimentiphilum sp.]|nr:amidohydrolase family protein [Candidatus Rubrimentiphilum sp.]